MRIVFLGLSITSSWGNGHATTYRGLVRELSKRGHQVLFLERDVPWYAENRDLPDPPYGRTALYTSLDDLRARFAKEVAGASLVVVGSYVPQGIAVCDWVLETARGLRAFYDIDTPVTLAALERSACEYLAPRQVKHFDIYLSFTGGPTLHDIETRWHSPSAHALYCSFDPDNYFPQPGPIEWALGYLGTYSPDRQPKLERLLCESARQLPTERFTVAGPLYPDDVIWPENVQRTEHLRPSEHRLFYNAQRLTLNITREDMVRRGYSPSVRLFEAAACATPIVSDVWEGIEEIFTPGRDILLANSSEDILRFLKMDRADLRAIGAAGRKRVLACHTAGHRAAQLESIVLSRLPDTGCTHPKDRALAVSRDIH